MSKAFSDHAGPQFQEQWPSCSSHAFGSGSQPIKTSPDLIERQPLHNRSTSNKLDRKLNTSNASRNSSARRASVTRRHKAQKKSFHTSNFFNQTMTQMVQGKDRELFPLVNPRNITLTNPKEEFFSNVETGEKAAQAVGSPHFGTPA